MTAQTCWICGDAATTGEHMIKKSDLLAIFGKPKRGSPLFLHNAKKSNQIIQGLNADALKLGSRLCGACNSTRTQPYDRAWEQFSWFVRNRLPPIRPGAYIRADRIYPLSSNLGLRHVQLFFVKLFGCFIDENKIPIDLKPFSDAILNGVYHRDIFLRIGCVPRAPGEGLVGVLGLATATDDKTGKIAGAQWFYELDRFAVNVIYSPNHDLWTATERAWHPKFGTGRLLVHDFGPNLQAPKRA
jgi:hypothetical protein